LVVVKIEIFLNHSKGARSRTHIFNLFCLKVSNIKMEANKSALLDMDRTDPTDAEIFAIRTGKFTEEERDYLVKEGLMYEKDGQFFEIST
jgi:hypothetical protein